jgi:hypothetical protein
MVRNTGEGHGTGGGLFVTPVTGAAKVASEPNVPKNMLPLRAGDLRAGGVTSEPLQSPRHTLTMGARRYLEPPGARLGCTYWLQTPRWRYFNPHHTHPGRAQVTPQNNEWNIRCVHFLPTPAGLGPRTGP